MVTSDSVCSPGLTLATSSDGRFAFAFGRSSDCSGCLKQSRTLDCLNCTEGCSLNSGFEFERGTAVLRTEAARRSHPLSTRASATGLRSASWFHPRHTGAGLVPCIAHESPYRHLDGVASNHRPLTSGFLLCSKDFASD